MNELRIAGVVQSEGLARQVKAINNIAARLFLFLLVALALNQVPGPSVRAAEPALPKLKTETQEAFDRFVKQVAARNEGELKRGTDVLWVDALPAEKRAEAYAALKQGEVRIEKLEILDNDKPLACPGGMIHHWTGVVFVPRAKLEDVLGVLEDYDKHSVYYAPDVERSKIESREGDHFREREKAPGDDGGFMWRMETWWRMEERDSGVYVQSEVASLTRDIPMALAWMIKPFVTDIPKDSLTFTLQATRKAVEAHLRAR